MRVNNQSDKSPCLILSKLQERLYLERYFKMLLPELFGFIVVLILYFITLSVSVPIGDMSDIRQNLENHFDLGEVVEIHTFSGIYEYLYKFIGAAGRFDPLNPDRYVGRKYYDSQGVEVKKFNNNVVKDVVLIREKRFFAISALLVRPQVWMSRAERVPCSFFATQYDYLYSMARYFRYRYRGNVFQGGWAPETISWSDSYGDPPKLLVTRTPSGAAPAQKSEFSSPDGASEEFKSELLMCIAHKPFKMNVTMRGKLRSKYGSIATTMSGTTYFGDFYVEQPDILAYMGYQVSAKDVDFEKYPDCIMTSERNESTGEITKPKVTLEDVEKRCKKTADTWHDTQTHEIMAQLFLYTPEVEIFTKITVKFFQKQAGDIRGNYELLSTQHIAHSEWHKLFLIFAVLQIVMSLIQIGIICWRFCIEAKDARQFPSVISFGKEEKTSFIIGLLVQLYFVGVIAFGVYTTQTSDLWVQFEELLTRNPYHSKEAADATAEAQDEITEFFSVQDDVSIMNFILMALSMVQIVYLLKAHPNMGLVSNVLIKIAEDLAHFGGMFLIMFILLMLSAHFAFGAFITEFSDMYSTCLFALSFSLGSFDLTTGADKLPSDGYKTLLLCWQVFTLFFFFLVLLNFLLAIVVDGYAAIHESFAEDSANSFLTDVCYFLEGQFRYHRHGWIKRPRSLEYLATLPKEKKTVSVDDLCVEEFFGLDEKGRHRAHQFLHFYCRTVPDIDASLEEVDSERIDKDEADNLGQESARVLDLDNSAVELAVAERSKSPEAEKAELQIALGKQTLRVQQLEMELMQLRSQAIRQVGEVEMMQLRGQAPQQAGEPVEALNKFMATLRDKDNGGRPRWVPGRHLV